MQTERMVIGVDMGGTNIRLGLVRSSGENEVMARESDYLRNQRLGLVT